MRLRNVQSLAIAVAVCLSGLLGSTETSLARETSSAIAPVVKTIKFEGMQINLADGWGDAQACLIWDQAGASECFRTEAEMDQHVAAVELRLAAGTPSSLQAAQCSSWLYLYEHADFNRPKPGRTPGRVLQFKDRGRWQNLTDQAYHFNDQLSSYKVGTCGVHLAEHVDGHGYWYPGNTNALAQDSCMCAGSTNWNDRVSSIYIK